MISVRCCVFRPELESFPNISLPVFPRSYGYFSCNKDEYEYAPKGKKNFVQLFWCDEGEGEFEIEGKTSVLSPGYVVYRLPNQEHRIKTISETWKYYWVAFDGNNAESFMLSYDYPKDCFHAGKCPVENFENFGRLMKLRTPYAWRQMFVEIATILAKAGGIRNEDSLENRITEQIIRICNDRYSDPALNVNQIASEFDMCRTTLLNIFKKTMNQSISEYLQKVRIQHAMLLLKTTYYPICRISVECGFNDVNYFCRFIKKNTGKRPTDLR